MKSYKFKAGDMQVLGSGLFLFNNSIKIVFEKDSFDYEVMIVNGDSFKLIRNMIVILDDKKKVAMFKTKDVKMIY